MEYFIDYLKSNWQWMIQCFQAFTAAVFVIIYAIKNRKGKDIDGDGIPDVPAKFNEWYVLVDGRKIYLKDLRFYQEEKHEPEKIG